MTRENLDHQINAVKDEVLLLSSMVENATLNAMDALKNRDLKEAQRVYAEDSLINEKRFAIESAILILLATQQPMAHDLRILTGMLEVNTELERMGDYAKGIAKITLRLGNTDIPIPLRELSRMAELSVSMLHRAMGAFISENLTVAAMVPQEDQEVDRLYNQVYHTMVDAMIANPKIIDDANLIFWVSHNLERMADRVINICERTVFIATGEMLEVQSSDDEDEE